MENFCITSKLLGSNKNFSVSSDGFQAVDKVDQSGWVLDLGYRTSGPCIRSLFKLGHRGINTDPPAAHVRAMSVVAPDFAPPWSQVLPANTYRSFVKNMIKTVVQGMDDMPKQYCSSTWVDCGAVFDALKPAKIDSAAHKELSASPDRAAGLDSFKPGPGGFAPPIVYDRFGTRTGRLTVQSGPNILTLKKEYRRVLRSHFSDGKVVSLDFSALEARIILYEAGGFSSSVDLYQSIADDLFQGRASRQDVKIAVLGELYGASRSTLCSRLKMSEKSLDEFTSVIRQCFKTPELRSRLKSELDANRVIRNKHGRPLEVPDELSEHLLVNTFAQSTGVDVSLLGFKSILENVGTDGIRPLFVLHDALILDVRGDRLEDVQKIDRVIVPGFDKPFYLKFEELQHS